MDETYPDDLDTALNFALENEIDQAKLAIKVMQASPASFLEYARPDLERFFAEFMKANPQAFLSFAQQVVAGVKSAKEICDFIKAGNLVGAIKQFREDTGEGLKEAKDIIVSVRDQLVASGHLPAPTSQGVLGAPASGTLRPESQAQVKALVSAFKV